LAFEEEAQHQLLAALRCLELEAGQVNLRVGDRERALRHIRTAMLLLQGSPPDQIVGGEFRKESR
jgi:hypothetical protein